MFSEKEYLAVKHTLRFRENGKLRILFITDIHGGVGMHPQTKPCVDAVIDYADPDLILVGGDTFGCGIGVSRPEEVREYLDLIMERAEKKRIPWAHVYGNHDDNLGVSKEVQQKIYESYPFCVSKAGEEAIAGVGNYVLPVLRSDSQEPALNIWALDSHRSMPRPSQVNWYYETSKALEAFYGRKIPAILYQHIELPEYRYMLEQPEECGVTETQGETINFPGENTGLFSACLERGDVRAIFCGHEHLVDVSGVYKGIRLSFGASCSYDAGSANHLRGGRIIEISEDHPEEINTRMIHLQDIMGLKSYSCESRSVPDLEHAPEKEYACYANIFHGWGKADLPACEGIAATWHFSRAICGNTSPAAVLPFGKLSVGCYGGGYPAGYGNICANTDAQGYRTKGKKNLCRGFSHMHQSGAGAIGGYYNFAVVRPCYGEIAESREPAEMIWESGRPGHFGTDLRMKGTRVLCNVAVSPRAAIHLYEFKEEGGSLVIDLSNEGMAEDISPRQAFHARSTDTRIRLCGKDAFEAELTMRGVKLYFYGRCEQAQETEIWRRLEALPGAEELVLGEVSDTFGVRFRMVGAGTAKLVLSISTRSIEKARQDVLAQTEDPQEIYIAAYRLWDAYLGKIETEASTERDKRIFYSNLYHSLVKPSDWSGESYVYRGDGPFVTDIATIWHMYRTQLPLLFTLYPDISEKLLATFIEFCRVEGTMPGSLIVTDQYKNPSAQGRMLAEYAIYGAFVRGVRADYKAALHMAEVDLMSLHSQPFFQGTCQRAAYVADMAEACGCMAELAHTLGEDASLFERWQGEWKRAFDRETGLMKADSAYYEGSRWNFSFRPMRDMEARMEIAGGRENFVRLLDRFFGYTDPEDTSARFEGFHSVLDMDAPLAYYYAGRHDRMCEVMDAAMTYLYTEGPGGLPGNNGSGGLSSLYVWYAMGMIPVSGQDRMIVGTPRMLRTVLHLANGNDFEIRREGEGIYVEEALLNGNRLETLSFPAGEMMKGGTLLVRMRRTAV
ncbi:MAG: glycoside hydrolase family 92 protein [Roseburia sp.]|nr:glycoside hydrolase family 92 protein [Roseburia sp.]MCM1098178.1 glycoside hydrolase family 92 protein [Ruminococcus flavefaciens]